MADAGKRTKEKGGESIKDEVHRIGGAFTLTKKPVFLLDRVKVWETMYAQYSQKLAALEKRDIDVTLKDGKIIKGKSNETTPLEIAKKISKKLAEQVVVARVVYVKAPTGGLNPVDVEEEDNNKKDESAGVLWDLTRPLEGDCSLELLTFDDPAGTMTFWHSSAHILGQALENEFGGHLCIGPPLQNGFYYDIYIGENVVRPEQFESIENAFESVTKENQPFQRMVLTKDEALHLFKSNPFKVQLIQNKIPKDGLTTAYRCGTLIDLCTGPHLPSTGAVKAFKATKASAAYWLGKVGNDDLQRVYGITFPTDKQLKEWEKLQEELAKREHKNIGLHQALFNFSPLSPGSAFFFPHGALIYNKLIDFIRKEYRVRGINEVLSPNVYNNHLFEISGHLAAYKENMFQIIIERQEFSVKPMNCPGHCLMFDMTLRSYRDLPMRFADFGVLHRNELSGALAGLTRVRRFQQDDCHIFCTQDQIMNEVMGQLDFLKHVYDIFGFEFALELSTKPPNALGEPELWERAEAALTEALNKFGKPWRINPGDGAFYGPKIDIKLFDVMKREFQCGTFQLDFNLPIRFNLQYRAGDDDAEHEEESKGEERPKPVKEKKAAEPKPEKEPKEGEEKKPKKEPISEEEKKARELANREAKKAKAAQKEAEKPAEGEAPKEASKETKEKPAKEAKEPKEPKEAKEPKEQKEAKEPKEPKEAKEKKPKESKAADDKPKKEEHEHKEGKTECCADVTHAEAKKYEIGQHPVKHGFARPVIIHRAILGSVERFLAICCEHFAGKWPFWLSPRQAIVLPLSEKFMEYGEAIQLRLKMEGYQVEVDKTNVTLNKKIRNAQLAQFNFMLIVGEEERKNGLVTLRSRDAPEQSKYSMDELLKFFKSQEPKKSEAEKKVWEKAFKDAGYHVPGTEKADSDHLATLNKELSLKTYLNGDGVELGAKDEEEYAKIGKEPVDSSKYPNVFRWQHLLNKVKKA